MVLNQTKPNQEPNWTKPKKANHLNQFLNQTGLFLNWFGTKASSIKKIEDLMRFFT